MDNNTAAAKKKPRRQAKQSYWAGVFRRFGRNKLAVFSLGLLVIIVLACILVPLVSPYAMFDTDTTSMKAAPTAAHWLGTDDIGRDFFTRLFYGGRISLGIALTVTVLECILGVILGALAGFYGGIVDTVIMRLCDILLSFPQLMICITVVALFGNSIPILIMILVILNWPSIARIVRGQILTLREMEYMEACEALGINDRSRIFKHLFPNVLAYVIVYATLGMASVILVETSLSFIGLGVTMPTPTWGNMIQAARNITVISSRWWYWVPAGLSIFLSVMCFNIIGDGLRDAIDPKMKV